MKNEDLRVKRTKKLLSDALLSLMEDTPFNKLSVNEICNKAMVHRATFYNHFYDKEDLLDYIIDDMQEDLFNASINSGNYTSAKQMYLGLSEKILDYISENKIKVGKILANNSQEKTLFLFSTALRRSIKYLLIKNKFNENCTIPVDILASFFTGGLAILIGTLLSEGNNYSKEEMLGYFDKLLPNDIFTKKD